jgi:hypothetical protein
MSGVFISYRRADAQGWAGRLGADLGQAFGEVARFFDLASIAAGADFVLEIEKAMADAAAVLVLIGPRWVDLRNEQGVRRLVAPDDVVAHEVKQALSLTVPVIPVLLGGASMPDAAALPEPLRALARRNAIELSDTRWAHDFERLLSALEAATPLRRRLPEPAVGNVSVGAGLQVRDSEVGRVTGVRGAMPARGVDVLQGAALSNVKIGDITGVELAPPATPGAKE